VDSKDLAHRADMRVFSGLVQSLFKAELMMITSEPGRLARPAPVRAETAGTARLGSARRDSAR